MAAYETMSRAELIATIHVLEAKVTRAAPGDTAVAGEDMEAELDRQRDLLFDRSARPMRIHDAETGAFLKVNDAAVRLYGYSREEFLAMKLSDIRVPEDIPLMLQALRTPAGYMYHRGTRRHRKKSGEIIEVDLIAQDILYKGRKARVALIIDVTERNRAVEQLRQREHEFETLADNMPDIVARFDRNRRYVYVNAAAEKYTGIPRERFIGKTHRELGFHDCLVKLWRYHIMEVFDTGQGGELEFDYETPRGTCRFETRLVPERGSDGAVRTVLAVARDIAARKQAEEALRASEEFLRRLIESSRDCIKVIDLDGRLLWMNEAGRQLLEIDEDVPLLHRQWEEILGDVQARELVRNGIAAARGGGTSSFKVYCPTTKGTPKWWDVIVTPILDAGGNPEKLLAISRDITEQRRAEEEKLAQVLRQRDALVREVHHRIKNHLQGVAALLKQKVGKDRATAAPLEAAAAQLQSVAAVYGLHSEAITAGVGLRGVLHAVCSSVESMTGERIA
ncbi:MAG: PAS domain S-box protein, partial [Betaproteobacteria bacterium]|nr:PAS domain S-box protein [Betaproteobacteria bacterium]